jgi:hypothetical protein
MLLARRLQISVSGETVKIIEIGFSIVCADLQPFVYASIIFVAMYLS